MRIFGTLTSVTAAALFLVCPAFAQSPADVSYHLTVRRAPAVAGMIRVYPQHVWNKPGKSRVGYRGKAPAGVAPLPDPETGQLDPLSSFHFYRQNELCISTRKLKPLGKAWSLSLMVSGLRANAPGARAETVVTVRHYDLVKSDGVPAYVPRKRSTATKISLSGALEKSTPLDREVVSSLLPSDIGDALCLKSKGTAFALHAVALMEEGGGNTPTSTPAVTPPVGGGTVSPPVTPTPGSPATATNTAIATNTVAPQATSTPVQSTPTHTPTMTNTPGGPTATPTNTPTLTPTQSGNTSCTGGGIVAGLQSFDLYSNIETISADWYFTAGTDSDHDARGNLQYKVAGTTEWKDTLPMKRVDHRSFSQAPASGAVTYNMLSGSALYLQPATLYDIRVQLTDPDGCARTEERQISTRAIPSYSALRTFHVHAGTAAGTGTQASPYNLAQAMTAARAGDLFLLHQGTYGGTPYFNTDGAAGQYIVWKAAGDGKVLFRENQDSDAMRVLGDYQWFEGLNFEALYNGPYSAGLRIDGAKNVVVSRCNFLDVGWGIYVKSNQGSRDIYVADSVFVGNNVDPQNGLQGSFDDHEGVELWWAPGSVVIHNKFSLMGDAVSYPGKNSYIKGNDVADVSDDAFELDYAFQSVFVVNNRATNIGSHPLSFQAENMGPWYFVRNQIEGWGSNLLKLKCIEANPEDNYFVHNTFIGWKEYGANDGNCNQFWVNNYSRNNIFYTINGGATTLRHYSAPVTPTYKSDIDYDAFSSNSLAQSQLRGAHELAIPNTCLAGDFTQVYETPYHNEGSGFRRHLVQHFALTPTCTARNSGAVLPNVNESFVTDAQPDRGALEFGQGFPLYGPRL